MSKSEAQLKQDLLEATGPKALALAKRILALSVGGKDTLGKLERRAKSTVDTAKDPSLGASEKVATGAANAVGGASDVVFSHLGNAVDAVTPDVITDPLKALGSASVEALMNTEGGQWVSEQYQNLSPDDKRRLGVLGDTTSLIPATRLSKAVPELRALSAQGKDLKGSITAAADNYISNHYVPKGPDEPTTMFEKLIAKGATGIQNLDAKGVKGLPLANQLRGLTPEQIKGASESKASDILTILRGAKGATKDLLSPTARARFRDEGIAGENQRLIKAHLDNPDGDRALPKAGALGVYAGHNISQGGGKVRPNTALEKYLKKSFLEPYTPNEKGTIAALVQKHIGTKAGKKNERTPLEVSNEDAQFIENYVTEAWGPTANVVMKRPEGKHSGRHYHDATNPRNYGMSAIKNVFKKGPFESNDELAAALSSLRETKKNFKVRRGPQGEVFVTSSRPGTAIVEGGVNSLHKVSPDGEFWAVLSDKHDFLEKTPLFGKAVSKYLPDDLVAITPVMRGHVLKNVGKKGHDKTSDYVLAGRDAMTKERMDSSATEDLMRMATVQPSASTLASEQALQQGLLGMLAAQGVNQGPPQETLRRP